MYAHIQRKSIFGQPPVVNSGFDFSQTSVLLLYQSCFFLSSESSSIAQGSLETESYWMEAKWEKALSGVSGRVPLVFFGDSDVARWKGLETTFLGSLCCGAGGAQMSDCANYAQTVFDQTQPDIAIILAGENDLAMSVAPKDVVASSLKVADCALRFAKHVFFISTKPEPATTGLVKVYQSFNVLLSRALCQHPQNARLGFIDCFEAFSSLSPDLFARDGLHLSSAGYSLLEALVSKTLKELRFPSEVQRD